MASKKIKLMDNMIEQLHEIVEYLKNTPKEEETSTFDMEEFIAELKKKYTESENDNE